MNESRCSTCAARIRWAKTSNGGSVPLDAAPNPRGNLVVDAEGRIGSTDGGRPDLTTRYTRHTCPERSR